MHLVLNGGDEGKGAAGHVDGDLAAVAVNDGAGAVVIVLDHAVQRHIHKQSVLQRLFYRADLSLAAVQQDQVRLFGKVVVQSGAAAGTLLVLGSASA